MQTNRRRLTRYLWLWLPLVAAILLIYLGGEALASNEPARAPVAPPELWSDNFESYPPHSVFDPNAAVWDVWTHSGLKDTFVYTDRYHSPTRSLKEHGILGDCGGSAAYRPIGGAAPIEIEVWMRNGTSTPQKLSGCHPVYGALELSTQPSWRGDHRGLVSFAYEEDGSGNPIFRAYGGGWEVGDTAPRVFLRTYEPATWYKVRVRYEPLATNKVRLTYWIDDVQVAQQDVAKWPYENNLLYLGLWVGEGVAWHDDVTVYATEIQATDTDLALSKSVNSTSVQPGERFTYTLSVTNNGPGDTTGVLVEDTLPAGVTYQEATPALCQEDAGSVSCALGTLPAGATSTVNVEVVAPASAARVVNSATVTHDAADPNTANNSDSVSVQVSTGTNGMNVHLPLVVRAD